MGKREDGNIKMREWICGISSEDELDKLEKRINSDVRIKDVKLGINIKNQ